MSYFGPLYGTGAVLPGSGTPGFNQQGIPTGGQGHGSYNPNTGTYSFRGTGENNRVLPWPSTQYPAQPTNQPFNLPTPQMFKGEVPYYYRR